MARSQRIHANGIAHARELGAERGVRADLGGVRDAELVQELLEDRELGLQTFEVLGAHVGSMVAEELRPLSVRECREAHAATVRGHGELV